MANIPNITKLLPKNFLGARLANTKVPAEKIDEVIDAVNSPIAKVLNCTSSTQTLTAAQTGSLVVLDRAAGVTVTLPAASTANIGVTYTVIVKTSVTSNAYIFNGATTSDLFIGAVVATDDVAAESAAVFKPDVSDDDSMSMNGTTTGGKVGTTFTLTCIAANRWYVEGVLAGSGVLATSFL